MNRVQSFQSCCSMAQTGVSDADDSFAALRREIDGLKERTRALESKEVAGTGKLEIG